MGSEEEYIQIILFDAIAEQEENCEELSLDLAPLFLTYMIGSSPLKKSIIDGNSQTECEDQLPDLTLELVDSGAVPDQVLSAITLD